MNIILLSGGSGKRLWPLSNDVRSKQFIKIFKDEERQYESMVQRVYRQIRKADAEAAGEAVCTAFQLAAYMQRVAASKDMNAVFRHESSAHLPCCLVEGGQMFKYHIVREGQQ